MNKVIPFLFLILLEFNVNLSAQNIEHEDSLINVTFSIVGDIMCHSTQYNYAMLQDSTFNFKPVYREIKEYFDNSDVVIGNLETVVAGNEIKYSGYPVFNTPEDFLVGLKYAGFDILTTGNNHAYDHKGKGVINTIDYINTNGMMNSGTYKSQSERDSVHLFNESNLKFVVLSYTYDVNLYRIPNNKSYLVNRINHEQIRKDITKAKLQNADLVIVYFHFGKEYSRSENRYQKETVAKAVEYGADIILGAHPHSLQPVEYFETNNAKIDTGFVAYSLGNFVSNQRWRYSDGGVILNFSITKSIKTNQIKLESVRYLPIWVFKGVTSWGWEYIVFPSEIANSGEYPDFFTNEDKKLSYESYQDSRKIIQSRTDKIVLDTIEKSNYRKWKSEQLKFRSFITQIPFLTTNKELVKVDSLQYLFLEE
ncbi:MAG: CapA family protein [Bacteroidota bacterium]